MILFPPMYPCGSSLFWCVSSLTHRSESSSGSGVLTALLKVRAKVNHQLRSLSCKYLSFVLGAVVFGLMPSPAPVDAGSGNFSDWEVDGPKRPGTRDDDILFAVVVLDSGRWCFAIE